MKIDLSNAGKRFNREWIFRGLTAQFDSFRSYAIIGPNGSGKSTLLQVLAGMLQLSEGSIQYVTQDGSKTQSHEHVFKHISFCAPYFEVIEEFTLVEFLEFHHQFKKYLPDLNKDALINIIGLESAANKQLRYYSSGMKQRVKLAQAILFDTDIVLLDEPCTNLDSTGIELYHSLIKSYCNNRLVIVSSNDQVEYSFCDHLISMKDIKSKIPAP